MHKLLCAMLRSLLLFLFFIVRVFRYLDLKCITLSYFYLQNVSISMVLLFIFLEESNVLIRGGKTIKKNEI